MNTDTINKVHLLLLILLCLISQSLAAQSDDIIILKNGDTLTGLTIILSHSATNQRKLSYSKPGQERRSLNSEELKEYSNGNNYFHSVRPVNLTENRLIRYTVGGYVSFGISYTSKGGMNFYVQRNDEVTALENHEFGLEAFFREYLEDYSGFKTTFKRRLSYDYKVLAEFISAYNAYKFPEQYKFERYNNIEKMDAGFILSTGYASGNLSGYYAETLSGYSLNVGIDIENKYSRYSSIHFPMTIAQAKMESEESSLTISTINLEPAITFKPFVRKRPGFEIGLGPAIQYAFIAEMNSDKYGKIKVSKVNMGMHAFTSILFSRKFRSTLTYNQYYSHSENLLPSTPEKTAENIIQNNLRIGIIYYF